MSEKADVLTCQFIEKLNGTDDLESRLCMAERVFSSHSIPMFRKEEIVILELCKLANSSERAKRACVVQCLQKCLRNRKMVNFSGDFSPDVVDRLLEVFSTHSVSPNESSEQLRSSLQTCAIALLSTPYFQRWFTCDVANLCKLLAHVLSAASPSSFNDVIKLMSLLSHITQNTLFKDETRAAFLESTFLPLCEAVAVIPDDEYNSLMSRVTDTFVGVVLYNPGFLDEFCMSKKDVKTTEGNLPPSHNFISMLKTTIKVKNDANKILKMCCRIFLLSSIKALKKDSRIDSAFDVFQTLCKLLGCRVDKKISISWKPLKNLSQSDSYSIIADMVDILDQSEVPLSIDYGTYTLDSWFMSLVIGTTSINLTELSPELLRMVERVFRYNPLIIESCSKIIADVMVCKKSENILSAYICLMKAVLDGAFQIQRLQKVISALLSHLKSTVDAKSSHKSLEGTILEDVIPKDLSAHFAETVVMIPNSQILSIFKDMLDHFQHDCLNLMEASCTDVTVVIMSEVISELLRQLLFSAKIADHSVPDIVKSKFNVLLEDLRIILEKMGTILVDDHQDRLLKSFLDVCHAFGAVNLMIEEYQGSPIKPVSKQDCVAFNFSYVHPYISPQMWKRICESITDHEDCLARRSLYKLMVQKVEAVAQVEEGSEGPGTQTARRLLTISDPQWLWKEITNLAPLFQANEVAQLIATLINSLGFKQDRWLELIKQDEFLENRQLVLALALQLLNKSANLVKDGSNSLGDNVMRMIKIEDILEYELSLLITEDEHLAEGIEESLVAIKKIINDRLELESVDDKKFFDISFARVLYALPLHHFSGLTQSCLSLAVIGILGQLPPYPDLDNLLIDVLFRALNTPANNTAKFLVVGLNSGLLLKFLANRGASYPSLKPLLKILSKESLNDKKTSKKLIKAVSKPTVNDVWLTTIVIEEIHQFKKKKDAESEEGDEVTVKSSVFDKYECLDSLVRKVVPILENETPTLNLLPTYSVILKLQFKLKNDFGGVTIRNKVEDYLRLCQLDPEQGSSLVDTLISFRNQLDNKELQKTVALDGWKMLIKHKHHPKFSSRLNTILSTSTDEEFKVVTTDLLAEMSVALKDDSNDRLSSLFELWSPVVTSLISFKKGKIRQEALISLAKHVVPVVERWNSTPEDKTVGPILKFFTTLASATSVDLKPAVLDTILVSLQSVPLPADKPVVLSNNLAPAIEAFFALYLFRNVLILDRLHVYLPIYKLYLEGLARISHPESEHIEHVFPCADKLERVSKTLVKRHKDFARLAQYVVADVISILERNPLHSEVKLKYTNIINTFLTLCDEHAVSYLTFNLPPASQELFKALHQNFKKYHKYVGKI